MKYKMSVIAAVIMALTNIANATEGGGSIYPVGAENFTCCALPPPGVYGMVWGQSYSANKVKGNDGQVVTPSNFKVTANAIVPRVVWITPTKIGDASLGFHAILPLVDLDVKNAPPGSQHKSGIGDMTLGAVLGWHHSANLHSVVALDVFAPTGSYSKSDIANIGRNYWAIQPVAGFSYIDQNGLNGDIKAMWTYNLRNRDTDYKSGQELIIDYSVGWGLGNGWTLGVGGYVYQQLTKDSQNGSSVENNNGKALAIGPSVRYDSGKGWFVTGKYQTETSVRNRAEGSAFWVKAVFPF
ncbi:SphA family protein [Ampullimonas aquatilis]|uniref:SphA family protein n=1 Tax=Ampullimonas aquatilis TaxID=1341549 RepID=UPI003C73B770